MEETNRIFKNKKYQNIKFIIIILCIIILIFTIIRVFDIYSTTEFLTNVTMGMTDTEVSQAAGKPDEILTKEDKVFHWQGWSELKRPINNKVYVYNYATFAPFKAFVFFNDDNIVDFIYFGKT
jgi:hypothetical protein